MENILKYAKPLSEMLGTSGDESDVTKEILKLLPAECDSYIDNIGNLIVTKKGTKAPKNKVMIAAHMDEVGFIVTYITSDGYLRFTSVGGINDEVVLGRRVIFKNGTVGVIGTKAIHLQSKEEREKNPEISKLLIDIGAKTKEEAEAKVNLGDCAYFVSKYTEFGDDKLMAKALDDRLGCAMMIDLLNGDLPYDVTCAFTVQEEIGTRGSACAAFNVKPDYAIVLECTTACDFSGNDEEKKVCELGRGVVITYMDRGTLYSRDMYKLATNTADEKGIKWQTKTVVAGGNDAKSIHRAVGGIKTAALSVPCRYLHSPSCMVKKSDIKDTSNLCRELYIRLCEI